MATRTNKPIGELETGYARALLELARDTGTLEEVAGEISQMEQLLRTQPDLVRLVTNRLISAPGRAAMIERVFSTRVSTLTYRFLRVMASKNRLYLLPQVIAAFARLMDDHRGRLDAQITVAVELGEDLRNAIAQRVGLLIQRDVQLTQRVDPSLIGGLKLRLGDRLIDASVAAQLRAIRRRMTKTL